MNNRTITRRSLTLLIVGNLALALAAAALVPTFGQDGLAGATTGTSPLGARNITAETVLIPAIDTLDQIATAVTDDPAIFAKWTDGRDGTDIEVAPIETGCFAKGAPAAVAARTHGWTRGPLNTAGLASESAMWTLRAYSAGQGAALIDHVNKRAGECGVGVSRIDGLGSDAIAYSTSQVTTLLWRRGDVISTLGYQRNRYPGGLAQITGDANRIDTVIKDNLGRTCLDPKSSRSEDRGRSPYVNAKAYTGRKMTRTFDIDPAVMRPPADWERTGGRDLDEVDVETLPDQVDREPQPSGDLAVKMPTTVVEPETPTKPKKPGKSFRVAEQVDDPDGPGCGWAFTGQKPPPFDADAARVEFDKAVKSGRGSAEKSWAAWFPAVVDYKDAYEAYAKKVARYNDYVQEVRDVDTMWGLINDARDDHEKALADYDESVKAREKFLADQAAAKEQYADDVEFCEAEDDSPGRDETRCPAVKPRILSQKAPTVGKKPKAPDEEKIVARYRKDHPR